MYAMNANDLAYAKELSRLPLEQQRQALAALKAADTGLTHKLDRKDSKRRIKAIARAIKNARRRAPEGAT